jgi:hypothetical protein
MKNTQPHHIAMFAISLFFLLSWSPSSGFKKSTLPNTENDGTAIPDEKRIRKSAIEREAVEIYQAMRLQRVGLKQQAFITAWTGYQHLIQEGRLNNTGVLTICDYSQSSSSKRLYILDIHTRKLLLRTYVAHGRNSGSAYASDFSNKPSSYKSCIGFFITGNVYRGVHGQALSIEGLDKGFNDLANDRRIVIHGADYVGQAYLRANQTIGRSLGCPAVPRKETARIIQTIRNGSCFFIYHPSSQYLERSTVLNG